MAHHRAKLVARERVELDGLCPSSDSFESVERRNRGRLWLIWFMLGGFPLVLQASFWDGMAFDPFSLQQDCLAPAEVDIGGG